MFISFIKLSTCLKHTVYTAGTQSQSWHAQELLSKALLAEAQGQLTVGNHFAAEQALLAAGEALLSHTTPEAAGFACHPVQHAALQTFQARLALSCAQQECRPSVPGPFRFVDAKGHRCQPVPTTEPKTQERSHQPASAGQAKPCSWSCLLERQLWSLLACVDAVSGVPQLFR